MPNGGSDCCATSWFNRKNRGEAGYGHAQSREPAHCEIRDLPIVEPFYTYCANHPHRMPDRQPVPLGPVFTGDSFGNRTIWKPAPESEEIRLKLVEMLTRLPATARDEYPIGRQLGDLLIQEIIRLKEQRAIPELQRIATLEIGTPDRFGNTNEPLIASARQALAQLSL